MSKKETSIKLKSNWIRKVGCLLLFQKQDGMKTIGFKLPLRTSNIPADAVIMLDAESYRVMRKEYLPKERLVKYIISNKPEDLRKGN